jgi:hypothetical protein
MFGCPQRLTEKERERINQGMKDGAADPNPAIRHSDLSTFLRRSVGEHGLSVAVPDAVERARDVRETINYGPRILTWPNGDVTVENCAIQPSEVAAIVARIPSISEEAVTWACKNAEFNGTWIASALGQAHSFFMGPNRMYGGWCSDETALVAEQLRQALVKIANQLAFSAPFPEIDT